MMFYVSVIVLIVSVAVSGRAQNLVHTAIIVVTDETRYQTQNPDCPLNLFDKVRHPKGSYVFNKGMRISGDRLLLNYNDGEKFGKGENVQVLLTYPAVEQGDTITAAEIIVDVNSKRADTFFVGGGIDEKYAKILLECNGTDYLSYEIFIYGY